MKRPTLLQVEAALLAVIMLASLASTFCEFALQ